MKNSKLQEMLKEFDDDVDILIAHTDCDWKMIPTFIMKCDEFDYLTICTVFKNE